MQSSELNTLGGLIWQVSALSSRIKEAFGETARPSDIARATKRSKGAVTQWLDGSTKSLKGDTAALMEAATGYRAAWLISGKGPRKVADMAEPPSAEEMAVLVDFRALMVDDQIEIAAEIKARADKVRAHVAKIRQEMGFPVSPQPYAPAPPAAPHTVHESAPIRRRRSSGWLPVVQEQLDEEGDDVSRVQDQKDGRAAGRSGQARGKR